MSSDSDPTKWVMAAHTAAKHRILRDYLSAWFPILTRWNGKVLYVDGFAGRGRYDDGSEGSPQIALRTLLEHSYFASMSDKTFVFMFVEKNRDNCAALEAELANFKAEHSPWPINVEAYVYNASFDDHMKTIVDALEAQSSRLAPTFAFIDPFGYTRFPMELLGKIVRNDKAELFINFMVGFVQRFIEREGQQNAIRELYGLDPEAVVAQIDDREDRIEQLVELYEAALRTQADGVHTQRFFMVNATGNVSYAMVHASRHEKAVSAMKAAMWKADPTGNYTFSDRIDGEILLFTPEPDIGRLCRTLKNKFSGRLSVPTSELKRFVLLQTPFRETHATKAMRQMEKAGKLTANRPHSRAQFSDGVTLNFG